MSRKFWERLWCSPMSRNGRLIASLLVWGEFEGVNMARQVDPPPKCHFPGFHPISVSVSAVGEPYWGKPDVRFDEGDQWTVQW